jgi:hypothetical protein
VTRKELGVVIDTVIANWNLKTDRNQMGNAWWRYLGDLDFDPVMAAIDVLVLADGHPPRAGAVRRGYIDRQNPSGLPSVEQAWALARTFVEAHKSGADYQSLAPLVLAAVKEVGVDDVARGYPNAFKASYGRMVDEANEARYALPDAA